MKSIKYLFLDVGGVAILDFSGTNKWTEMRRDLGITEETDAHFDLIWKKYESRICIDFDVDNLVSELKQIEGVSLASNYSMLDDFINRFNRNASIWPLVKAAKQKYKIGLLTNMYPKMFDAITSHNLIPDIEWDAIIDSSVVGYQKPQPEIYEHAEKVAQVKPEDIFFVDNTQTNIDEASRRGWKTFLYDPRNPEESSQQLSNLLGL